MSNPATFGQPRKAPAKVAHREAGWVTNAEITTRPTRSDPMLDGDHERMSHIVLEGYTPEDGEYVATGPSVVEGIVNATPVKALCGKVWVPGRDPKRHPLCPTCKEIAESMGWSIPS